MSLGGRLLLHVVQQLLHKLLVPPQDIVHLRTRQPDSQNAIMCAPLTALL